jgi:signal peptidase I
MVPTSKVTGRVIGIIWPIKNFGLVGSYSSLK